MATAGDLNKVNGDVLYAEDVTALLNSQGSIFNEVAQNLFDSDYNGFDSRLNNTGAPKSKNVFYSTFTSDDADEAWLMDYDSTNDLYKTPDLSTITEFIIIEATSYNGTWTNGTNDTYVFKVSDGKWVVYCDTGTDNVRNAQIHKSLWFGTGGLILDFTTVTAVKSTFSNDVGKQAYYATTSTIGQNGGFSYVGTPSNTSTNTISSWSNVFDDGGVKPNYYGKWSVPSTTLLNESPAGSSSNEIGTDKTGDDKTNPADMALSVDNSTSGSAGATSIVLSIGSITWVKVNGRNAIGGSYSNIDFKATHSIPDITAAGNYASEIGYDSALIFKDTVASTDNAIAVINSTIDATSSEQISVSADGGSNWTDVNNAEIANVTAGTALWRKIVITRTDLTKEDIVTEQAVKYNLY